MKYTAVVNVKMDVIVNSCNEDAARIKAHDNVLNHLAPLMEHDEFDGATIGEIGISERCD